MTQLLYVVDIAVRSESRAPMQLLNSVPVTVESGLQGDYRGRGGRSGKRQVTLLSLPQWQDVRDRLKVWLPWHTRRANLFMSGIMFGPEHLGKHIIFDGGVILEVTGETEPCDRMDEECPGLLAALTPLWRGGITCRVIQDGVIEKNQGARIPR